MTTFSQIPPALYLILDLNQIADPRSDIKAALKEAPIPSLFIKTTGNDQLDKDLVEFLQSHNIAVVLSDLDAALKLGADGLHLKDGETDNFERACTSFQNEEFIGVSAGHSRHTIMTLAEKGASYIAFQANALQERESLEPSNPKETQKGTGKEASQTRPTLEWWSGLFQTPSVAWNLETIDAVRLATRCGADFIAPAPSLWQAGENTADQIGKLITAINQEMKISVPMNNTTD